MFFGLKPDPVIFPDPIIELINPAYSGSLKWYGGALSPINNAIYCAPRDATSILKIDSLTGNSSLITGIPTGSIKYYGAVTGVDGKVYIIPANRNDVILIDPNDDSYTFLPTGLTGNQKYQGGVLAPNGCIYCAGFNIAPFLKINTFTNEITSFGNIGGSGKFVGGVLAPNGFIYFIPFFHPNVIKFNWQNDTWEEIPRPRAENVGGVVANNQKIYFSPLSGSTIGVLDTKDDSVYTISGIGGAGNKCFGAVSAPNGRVYLIPRSYNQLVEINPVNDSLRFFPVSGNDWIGGILSSNNEIFCVPYSGQRIMKISNIGNANIDNFEIPDPISELVNSNWNIWQNKSF